MSDLLVVVPDGWERCTQTMVDSAVAICGDFSNVQAWITSSDLAGLGSALDENRFPTPESVIEATIVQDQIFIKTRFL